MRAIASMSFDECTAYTESQIALLATTEDAREGVATARRMSSWPVTWLAAMTMLKVATRRPPDRAPEVNRA